MIIMRLLISIALLWRASEKTLILGGDAEYHLWTVGRAEEGRPNGRSFAEPLKFRCCCSL